MYEDLPKSRPEAMKSGVNYYFTGTPCMKGHVEKRQTGTGKCHRCWMIVNNARRKAKVTEFKRLRREAAKKDLERPLACDPL